MIVRKFFLIRDMAPGMRRANATLMQADMKSSSSPIIFLATAETLCTSHKQCMVQRAASSGWLAKYLSAAMLDACSSVVMRLST
eukprot:4618474-Lingulodinium_polyedra.AAC.1